MRKLATRRTRIALFVGDREGSVAVFAAAGLLMLVGFTAIAVDMSSYFFLKRKQQTATDLAALSAALNLAKASQLASANMIENGYNAKDLSGLEIGTYVADPSIPAEQRFRPGEANANAVRVRMLTSANMIFARALAAEDTGQVASIAGGSNATGTKASSFGSVKVRTSAIATRMPSAAFAIGSRLAALDGGVENAILGALLGAKLSLSVMDYNALATAQLDLFQFSEKLATKASLTGLTYDALLSTRFRMSDLLGAALDVMRAQSGAQSATNALSQILMVATGPTALPLSSLIDFGPYKTSKVGSKSVPRIQVPLLDLINALAQKSNGANLIQTNLAPSIPGILAARLQLSIGERPVGTSFVRIDRTGASVHTAQTRLLLTVQLVGTGAVSLISLPIYIEIAPASARLSAIQCNGADATNASVTLGVQTGVVDGWIGAVKDADFTNFVTKPSPKAANLVNLPLLSVSGRAHATVANLSETPLTFSMVDIESSRKKTTSTTQFVAPLLTGLTQDLQLTVTPLGIGLPLPGVGALVAQSIGAAVGPIDSLLAQTLSTLGVGLGQADAWVTGVRCGGAVLVN